jgi:hypothetical protein
MVPVIHTLCTRSKNEATDLPCNDSNQTLYYTALNTTGIDCSDYLISLYDNTAERHSNTLKYSIQTSCVS